MIKYIISIITVSLALSACGGGSVADAQSTSGSPAPSTTPPITVNTQVSVTSSTNVATTTIGGTIVSSTGPIPALGGLAIQHPASPLDGWLGGLSVRRDCISCVGGAVNGGVSSANYTYDRAGTYETEFEWAGLDVLDSWSNSGQNVARYGQGNQYGTGPVWGMVAESASLNNGTGGALTGLEVDSWTNSADNGWRLGIGVFAGDVAVTRGTGKSPANGSTVGVLVGTYNNDPTSSWLDGLRITNIIRGAAINLSQAITPIGIRLAAGQSISLEGTDTIKLNYLNGKVNIMNGNTPVFSIDPNNGDIYKNGVKVL